MEKKVDEEIVRVRMKKRNTRMKRKIKIMKMKNGLSVKKRKKSRNNWMIKLLPYHVTILQVLSALYLLFLCLNNFCVCFYVFMCNTNEFHEQVEY